MGHNGVGGVVGTGEAHQIPGYDVGGKGADDLHDRSEHQLGSHGRDGNVDQFLPPVLDALDGAGFILGTVDILEACTERQESGTQTDPQLYHDDYPQNVLGVGEPLDSVGVDAQVDEHRIGYAVGITTEDQLPHGVHICHGGRIEDQGENGFQPGMQLVDEPRQQKAQHIADGAGEQCEHQGDTDGFYEDRIRNEQIVEVGQSHPLGELYHVKVGHAHGQGHDDRNDGEYQEEQHKGKQHQIAFLVLLDLQPGVMPLLLFASPPDCVLIQK